MNNSNDNSNDNSNNHSHNEIGMLTSIWGSSTWKSLHCMSFVYPEQPSESDKLHYKTYFQTLKYVLPCCVCRKHYTEHTAPGAKFEITDEVFYSKSTLTKWLFELHNNVDNSLGMYYDITYKDLCKKYNSYITECEMSLEQKTIAYKNAYDQEAPFVLYKIADCFTEYASQRGLENYKSVLNNTNEMFKTKRDENNNISENWIKRNSDYWDIVKNMKVSGIIGFEKSEENHNLPTIEELKLLQLMSTTLSLRRLKHMLEKLGFESIANSVD